MIYRKPARRPDFPNGVHDVAKKFAIANCLNPGIAAVQFPDTT